MASVYKDTESSYKKFCPPNLKRVPTPMYVVLLSRTASPSPAVIDVTVKIQIGRMTMIGQGDGEEVVWRRF